MAVLLVADDHRESRVLARYILTDAGHDVVEATGGVEAIAAFAARPADCVVLDVQMPDIDGVTACARIRALPGGADVPILFVTADRSVDVFDAALGAGGDEFITKPYRPAELVARVDALLKLRRLTSERGELFDHVRGQRDNLQRLQLQREQLTAFLVHDLKNPVNAIELTAQAALRDPEVPERLRRQVERIRAESRVLLRMITDVLDLAKADELGFAFTREDVGLADVAAELLDANRARAEAIGARITLDVDGSARADRALLRRVLDNLVDNALRYAPEGSEIRLVARRGDHGVELSVIDGGPGVPAEQRTRVFDRFARGNGGSPRTNYGLGLAFCKLVVDAHGGRIWIEDATPGAAFHVWLPDG